MDLQLADPPDRDRTVRLMATTGDRRRSTAPGIGVAVGESVSRSARESGTLMPCHRCR
jgi:hypothetical protein